MAKKDMEQQLIDSIYVLSDIECDDPELRAAYEAIVSRMRKDAERLPFGTHHQLMIERIAHNYIVMRQMEKNAVGAEGGYPTVASKKEYNNFWLNMATEFNKMLRSMEEQRQDKLLATMRDIVVKTLEQVEDNSLRSRLLDSLADEFEEIGIV